MQQAQPSRAPALCMCRWRNSPTPEHATAAHAHAHVPHARSVQPVRECPRFRAVKCDSVFIGRAAWHTPTLSMWHPGKSPLSRLPAFRVSGDSTTITSEGWQKTHARRMYPPRAQAFVSHSPRYIGKLCTGQHVGHWDLESAGAVARARTHSSDRQRARYRTRLTFECPCVMR